MSEAAASNFNENIAQLALLSNQCEIENVPPPVLGASPATERVQKIAEDERSPSVHAAATSPNEQKAQPETGLNETLLQLQLLRILTRDLPEKEFTPTSNNDEEIWTLRKKLFGLITRTESNNVNNRFDYEQKYPVDRPGEELGPSARVWSTYLDEAEAYDREKVEGWKETADVLLVFAGLFSGVITTFVSQASQSLQQDNTQVSASLLFETTQLLRAQFSGIPINNVPSSTLTPTSPFIPSANALLVNGLWFTSLAITLSTALFAVLAKQWLYYYLSSISGTPRDKARARQFRFQGFESWKVGAIIDLLPILLHLAVGIFLTGIIILLFPLDVQVARAIVAITGVTYVLYFVSVILPIRYPGCPYVTSLTIYIGVLFFFLPKVFHGISAVSKKVLHPGLPSDSNRTVLFWKTLSLRIRFSAFRTKRRVRAGLVSASCVLPLAVYAYATEWIMDDHPVFSRALGIFERFVSTIPKFTNWREEKIKQAVTNAAPLDSDALSWLYEASSATSVHRIIARCSFMHRSIAHTFESDALTNFWRILEVGETNMVDIRYGLCADLLSRECNYWSLLPSIPHAEFRRQLDEVEYQNYSHIAKNVINANYVEILKDAIRDDFKLPLVMWHCFLTRASGDDEVVRHIITSEINIFHWNARGITKDTAYFQTVLENSGESGKWKFDYLFRYFCPERPHFSSSEDKPFEQRYLLVVSIYRNLNSQRSLIVDKQQRQKSLYKLFSDLYHWLNFGSHHVSHEDYFVFFRDIFCVDAFWSESMTDSVKRGALQCLSRIRCLGINVDWTRRFYLMKYDDLSPIYQWCSRDVRLSISKGNLYPIFTLLLMCQNRNGLRRCITSSNDLDEAVSHFLTFLQNIEHCQDMDSIAQNYLYQGLMDLFMIPVDPDDASLFTVLHNSSVLTQLGKLLIGELNRHFSNLRLDRSKLRQIHCIMISKARSEQNTDSRQELERTAREFGQRFSVASQHQTNVENQSTQTTNHNSEECGQLPENENEHENNTVFHRMKRMLSACHTEYNSRQS